MHHPPVPLRLWIIGHNPSELAASTGYYYGNPRNAMTRLLVESGIFPATLNPRLGEAWANAHSRILAFQDVAPSAVGVGFTDLAFAVNNDAATVDVRAAVPGFLERVKNAVARTRSLLDAPEDVRRDADAAVREVLRRVVGGGDDPPPGEPRPTGGVRVEVESERGAEPRVVAFTSKTLFLQTMRGFDDVGAASQGARRGAAAQLASVVSECMDDAEPQAIPLDVLPAAWVAVFPRTRVFVLDSTSGRNAAHAARRERGFRAVSAAMHAFPWPPTLHRLAAPS
jgi:G:T/U-mismatch repair DNA glycosylase